MRKIRLGKIDQKYEKIAAPTASSSMRPSIGLQQKIGEFYQIKTEDLLPFKNQARKKFNEDEIKNLAETIRLYGIRQPLTIKKADEIGKYYVISGERRLRAAKSIGMLRVPCLILEEGINADEVALIENIQRANLHPVELADAYLSLIKDYNHGDQSKIGEKLGVSKSHVSETLSYASLPVIIKDYLIEKDIKSRAILRKLTKCKSTEEMKLILGLEQKKKKEKKKDLLRFFVLGETVDIEAKSFSSLNETQKKALKARLEEILINL